MRLSCRSHFVEVKEQKRRKERRQIIIDIFVFSSCRLRQQTSDYQPSSNNERTEHIN
jgi:hypothetical protein